MGGGSVTAVLIALMATGMPIAVVILATAIVFVQFHPDILNLGLVQSLIVSTQPFSLISVPLFILAGELMNASGITRRLMDFAAALTGHMVGGLAQVNVLLSALKGGMSGSANADAAMDAKTIVPEMVKRGYSPAFSSVVTAFSGLLSGLLPPSITLLLFGFVTNTSVGALFMGSIVPTIIMTAGQMWVTHMICKKRGYGRDLPRAALGSIGRACIKALPALAMPAIVVIGIRFGVFTPSEAGAVAVLYALIFCAVYRETRLRELAMALRGTVVTTAAIMFILAASSALSWVLTYERIPQAVAETLIGITRNPQALLLIIVAFLFLAGIFLEGPALILILAPMLMPAVTAVGIDPVHFGILFSVMALLAGVSPPVGTIMFTTCAITKVSIADFSRECGWYMALMIGVTLLIVFVPQTVTILARL